jgi:mono/diheme cytochrome c family protein
VTLPDRDRSGAKDATPVRRWWRFLVVRGQTDGSGRSYQRAGKHPNASPRDPRLLWIAGTFHTLGHPLGHTSRLASAGATKENTMNLRSEFAWVRAAGLISVLNLVACDGGAADTKKTEPAKAPVEVKAVEPVKPVTPPPPTDVKAADTAGDTKSADTAGADPTKAGDTKAADPTKAGDTKAGDTKAAAADTAKGKTLYEAKCKVCHGLDGKGTEAQKKNKIPDMTAPDWQTKHDNAAVVKAVTNGIDGTKMKAFKDKLSKEEIDAVAAYVKKM